MGFLCGRLRELDRGGRLGSDKATGLGRTDGKEIAPGNGATAAKARPGKMDRGFSFLVPIDEGAEEALRYRAQREGSHNSEEETS